MMTLSYRWRPGLFSMALCMAGYACLVDARTPGTLDESGEGEPAEPEGDADSMAGSTGAPAAPDAVAASGGEGGGVTNGVGPSAVPGQGTGAASMLGAGGSALAGAGGAGGGSNGTPNAGGATSAGGSGGACVDGSPTCTANGGLALLPVDGWVDGQSNALGVQGSFFVASDAGLGGPSTIAPLDVGESRREVCVTGSAGPVGGSLEAPDYANDWGAMVGLSLAQSAPGVASSGWPQQTPAGAAIAISFTLTGGVPPGMRLDVVAIDGSRYCAVLAGTADRASFTLPMSELRSECWAEGGAPLSPALLLDQLHWMINSSTTGAIPFDFCIEELSIVVAP